MLSAIKTRSTFSAGTAVRVFNCIAISLSAITADLAWADSSTTQPVNQSATSPAQAFGTDPNPIQLRLDAIGRVWLSGKSTTLVSATQIVRRVYQEDQNTPIRIIIAPQCPPTVVETFMRLLKSLHVPDGTVHVTRPRESTTPSNTPRALNAWLRRRFPSTKPSKETPVIQANSAKQLAEDLHTRGLALRNRTEGIIQYASYLAYDLQSLFSPPHNSETATSRPSKAEP
ncbi:MAG: hypothetical protein JSV03_10845 [Planctomycetota bacterium]|nr:MAG: hypothetical protein JSV03_10845 [Planctomycetota bacterium]